MCSDVEQKKDWATRLNADTGARIAAYRKQRKLTAQQLADRCAELGLPIERGLLAKIEKGIRQGLNVGEIAVFAKALGVPPILLLLPVGESETTEVLPGEHADTWAAFTWFTGERPFRRRSADGTWTATADDLADWSESVNPIAEYQEHEVKLHTLEAAADLVRHAIRRGAVLEKGIQVGPDQRESVDEYRRDAEKGAALQRERERDLYFLRLRMRNHGIQPPRLPERFEYIDKNPPPRVMDKDEISQALGEIRERWDQAVELEQQRPSEQEGRTNE